ncbi:hypothetical protein JCM14244_06870 [Venenivibrio stagnispumantis]|uniref:Tetratricopeptide repeat protein n=1 Tax=Venenivibrio stagnispumantis TaxID=407998 RepID=A0AA45WIN5_9AQUI|nr:hypothetical protein [Venenivibrio stagnispumantis]SMP00678.1 hypothetical protein SAMN06264868_101147 [Venenivibrio stagnispumantis]
MREKLALRYKNLFVFIISFFLLFLTSYAVNKPENEDLKLLKEGIEDYKNGDYYTAVDVFSKLTTNTNSPYYKDALFMLSKTYLQIGKKTGLKKYLWAAVYSINYYVGAGGKRDWDFYYTKASIYEALGFFERAQPLYKIASFEAKNEEEYNKSLIGLLRVSALNGKMDEISKNLIYIASSNPEIRKEQDILNGMIAFQKGDYEEAFKYFSENYRKFESYFIENPYYYYLVGETAYRLKNYEFAKNIFRKIVSTVKDDEIIRKAILRLADIEVIEKNKKLAFDNYYYIIIKYPDSDEATIAKLKIISLSREYAEKAGIDDIISFTVKTLISNRTNNIGRYALANFGALIFENPTPYLIDRLSWEISLFSPSGFNFEQREYINNLWKPYLLKVKTDNLCKLYNANPNFFNELFEKDVLEHILNNCKDINIQIELIKYLVQKYNQDQDKIKLVNLLINKKDFKKAEEILQTISNKDCDYYLLLFKIKLLSKQDYKGLFQNIKNSCKENKDTASILAYEYLIKNQPLKAYETIIPWMRDLAMEYNENPFSKEILNQLIDKLMLKDEYNKVIKITELIIKNKEIEEKDYCYINAISLISYVRLNNLSNAEISYNNIVKCKDDFSEFAKKVYENEKIIKEVKK